MEGGMASRLRACAHVCLCELAARARVRAAPKDMRVCLRMCARACQCARVQNVCVCVCVPARAPHQKMVLIRQDAIRPCEGGPRSGRGRDKGRDTGRDRKRMDKARQDVTADVSRDRISDGEGGGACVGRDRGLGRDSRERGD